MGRRELGSAVRIASKSELCLSTRNNFLNEPVFPALNGIKTSPTCLRFPSLHVTDHRQSHHMHSNSWMK